MGLILKKHDVQLVVCYNTVTCDINLIYSMWQWLRMIIHLIKSSYISSSNFNSKRNVFSFIPQLLLIS